MKTAKDFAKEAVERGIISSANESELELFILHYMEEFLTNLLSINNKSSEIECIKEILHMTHDYGNGGYVSYFGPILFSKMIKLTNSYNKS